MIATAGIAASLVSLVAALGSLVWLAVRAGSTTRAISALSARPGAKALAGIAAEADRISAGVSKLSELSAQAAAIGADIQSFAASSIIMNGDVRLVANAIEELLDTFVPSMRGCAAD